jgi:hypothetical protein
MVTSLSRVGALAAAMAFAACGATPSGPSEQGPLVLTVEPLPTLAGSASTAEFALKLRNTGTSPVDLMFPSSCQVMPYVTDRATGRIVAPDGGGWVCATVVTKLTLGPDETHVETAHIKAGAGSASTSITVPAGEYAIFARLEDNRFKLQSQSVPFSLR